MPLALTQPLDHDQGNHSRFLCTKLLFLLVKRWRILLIIGILCSCALSCSQKGQSYHSSCWFHVLENVQSILGLAITNKCNYKKTCNYACLQTLVKFTTSNSSWELAFNQVFDYWHMIFFPCVLFCRFSFG